jgi:hypothetical protein
MSIPQATQVTILATNVAQQLPNLPFSGNGPATLTADINNLGTIAVGNTNAVTTSNGYLIQSDLAGNRSIVGKLSIYLTNANQLWIAGTMNDVLSIAG